jgi:hypothetical protein
MTWYQAYDEVTVFPDDGTSYARILLYYTMGCASTGCSDWDYTVRLRLVDTVAGSPVLYEMGRAITPYGGYMATNSNGFDNSWTRTFVYDVTDYAQFLKGERGISVFYEGWSSGFSTTLDFAFIEGTPAREVQSVEVLYSGGSGYADGPSFESGYLVPRTVDLSGAQTARIRATPSGHGFDNNVNCAEFCIRDYWIKLNGTEEFRQTMWRDDCGDNPVFPQGGTWLYDRANWCPGSEAWTYYHEIPSTYFPASSSFEIDMDITDYSWSGAQQPSYNLDVHLIQYGDFLIQNDVELWDIIQPSTQYAYSRMNPICAEPIVEIRNNGGDLLNSCMITYGLVGGQVCYYNWTGNLAHGETETIVLGNINWSGVDLSNAEFFARVSSPNGMEDEVSWNNEKTSTVESPAYYEKDHIIVWFRSNAAPSENFWTIEDDLGNIMASGNYSDPSTIYQDTVYLDPGCYVFEFRDSDEDGISWWASPDGNGILSLRDEDGVLEAIKGDFGSKVVRQFTIGMPLGQVNSEEACDVVSAPSIEAPKSWMDIYPNPSTGLLYLEWTFDQGPNKSEMQLIIQDAMGRIVMNRQIDALVGQTQLDLSHLGAGMYIVSMQNEFGQHSQKLLLE